MPPPRGLLQQLDQFLHEQPVLPPEACILAACSGGADSVALLRLLHALNQGSFWHWKIVVAHVHHGLRGRASDTDEEFVRKLAKALRLPFCTQRLRLNRAGRGRRRTSENAARQARLAALEQMARRRRCRFIVLAHHADDQAETLLMRLLRGCGVRGLAGMRLSRRLGGGTDHAYPQLVRPLLPFSRHMLMQHLQMIGQPWRNDHTNTDRRYLRNRVRHQLLPQLEDYQPNIRGVLQRLSENARMADQAVAREARLLLRQLVHSRRIDHALSLPAVALRRASAAATALVLRRMIQEAGGKADLINHTQLLAAVRAIRRGSAPKTLEFSGKLQLQISRDAVRIRRSAATRRHSS